ncbi:MAG TPA: COX15/CtaA family protein [Gemmatimonadaceae bacterium]|nr:COX15/CtaA family protein [Gemmatimonadaceae bacterium]
MRAPLRRLSYAALAVAVAQIVFGAIVRISGSGMGCGNHWPKCYGRWFPPFDQPTLVIEWTHRLIAALLLAALVGLAAAAYARRREPGVGGRGGVLRAGLLALAMWPAQALLGAITVWLGNVWYATASHWLLAATLLAALSAAVMRAGGLGGACARSERASARSARGAMAGAAIALVTIVVGGMTATYPGANVACSGFPLCGAGIASAVVPAGRAIQMTHRVLALLLTLHVFGLLWGVRRRREALVVVRAVAIAAGLIVAQIGIAASMIALHLPPALRSLHQSTGALIWLTLFSAAYLARMASRAADEVPVRGAAAGAPAAHHVRAAAEAAR